MDDKYCYPGTDVLRNKLDFHGYEKLSVVERAITSRVEAELRVRPLAGNFDYAHLRSIHKALFSRLYDWAGEPRTVDVGKGVQFASCWYLSDNAAKIFKDLQHDNYLIGLPYDKAIKALAYYLGEINVLHPFREGNGRTQRLFIEYLAKATGLTLDLTRCTPARMLEASKRSAVAFDNTYFESILKEVAEPISLEAQREFLQAVSPQALAIFEKTSGVPDRMQELGAQAALSRETRVSGMSMDDWRLQISQARAADKRSSSTVVDRTRSDNHGKDR